MLDKTAQIGRWLGAAHNVSSHLCYYILSISGHVLARATLRRITETELQDPNVQTKLAEFDRTIESSLVVQIVDDLADLPPLSDLEPDEPDVTYDSICERDDLSDEAYDRYLGAELQLDRGGEVLSGTVKRRKRDTVGTLVGTSNGNPMLDTREYLVELSGGSEETYSANTITLSQVDSEGKSYLLVNEIINHRREAGAVCTSDVYVRSPNGNMVPRKTTKGWKLKVTWKSGETSWVPLKDLKESNPIELAEYAVANRIDGESSVVSRDSVRIAHTYTALMGMDA